jgi:hypothetical protein
MFFVIVNIFAKNRRELRENRRFEFLRKMYEIFAKIFKNTKQFFKIEI